MFEDGAETDAEHDERHRGEAGIGAIQADDTTTALPLYTSAVEGSRSTKRKKKSDEQKKMMKDQKTYKAAVADLGKLGEAGLLARDLVLRVCDLPLHPLGGQKMPPCVSMST